MSDNNITVNEVCPRCGKPLGFYITSSGIQVLSCAPCHQAWYLSPEEEYPVLEQTGLKEESNPKLIEDGE